MSEIINTIIELVVLLMLILLVHMKADIRFVLEACTIYLAAVIRHELNRER